VPTWSAEQVGEWLTSINMKDYSETFVLRAVTGSQLLRLDSTQMKVINL